MKYIFKNDFVLNLIRYLPKISLRFLKLLFSRKKLSCSNFRPGSYYSLEGALNQLLWQAENAVFITLSNSSHIFFDSGQLLFNVIKEQSQFELIAYGVNHTIKIQTQIKIMPVEKFEYDNIIPRSKTISTDFTKSIRSSNIYIKPNINQRISFQNSPIPKKFRKIQITFNHIDFIDNCSSELFNTNTVQEVDELRELIKNNIENL